MIEFTIVLNITMLYKLYFIDFPLGINFRILYDNFLKYIICIDTRICTLRYYTINIIIKQQYYNERAVSSERNKLGVCPIKCRFVMRRRQNKHHNQRQPSAAKGCSRCMSMVCG